MNSLQTSRGYIPTAHQVSGSHKAAGPSQPFPVKARLTSTSEALEYVAKHYVPELKKFAVEFEVANSRAPEDQDCAVEMLRMTPPAPTEPPLVIIGGMGPLAGADAFAKALRMFEDRREIVLLQLTKVPDRSTALKADANLGGVSEQHRQVLAAMQAGYTQVESQVETLGQFGQAHVVVACNTAHNFAPKAFTQYKQERGPNAGLKFFSMVDCVVAEVKRLKCSQALENSPVIILGTEGTLKTRLYIDPIEKNGVATEILDFELQDMLTTAIYKGVKAFNEKVALDASQNLFLSLSMITGQIKEDTPTIVIAACTEVPLFIEILKDKGNRTVKRVLEEAVVVDPMLTTLEHISRTQEQIPANPFPMAKL